MVSLLLLALACKDDPPVDSVVESTPECPAGRLDEARSWTATDLDGDSGVAAPNPLDHPNYSGPGMAVLDIDQDGWLDIAPANPDRDIRVLMGGEGGFTVGELVIPQAVSIAAADLDGDGADELFVGRWDGASDLVGRPDGAGGYTWTELPGTQEEQSHGFTFADFDGDGDLDLFLSRSRSWPEEQRILSGNEPGILSLYFENQNGELVADAEAVSEEDAIGLTFLAQVLDAEGDGDLDLYLGRDFGAYVTPNLLLLNDGSGRFSRDPGGTADLSVYGMGIGVGDIDGNAQPDLYVTNIGSPILLTNFGGSFVDATAALKAEVPPSEDRQTSWGTALIDLDLDGWPEAPVRFGTLIFWFETYVEDSNGVRWDESQAQPDALMWNQDGVMVPMEGFDDDAAGRGLVTGDWNRDGLPDLMTASWVGTEQIRLRAWLSMDGCGERATLQVPPGTRVRSARGTQWAAPVNSFSSSAHEVYLALDAGDQVEVQLPGQAVQTLTLEAGEIRSLW